MFRQFFRPTRLCARAGQGLRRGRSEERRLQIAPSGGVWTVHLRLGARGHPGGCRERGPAGTGDCGPCALSDMTPPDPSRCSRRWLGLGLRLGVSVLAASVNTAHLGQIMMYLSMICIMCSSSPPAYARRCAGSVYTRSTTDQPGKRVLQ